MTTAPLPPGHTRPPAPPLSAEEEAVVARFEAAEPAPESFDAVAACRRVLDFAKRYERGEIGDPGRAVVAWMITVALADSASGIDSDGGHRSLVTRWG